MSNASSSSSDDSDRIIKTFFLTHYDPMRGVLSVSIAKSLFNYLYSEVTSFYSEEQFSSDCMFHVNTPEISTCKRPPHRRFRAEGNVCILSVFQSEWPATFNRLVGRNRQVVVHGRYLHPTVARAYR